MSQSKQAEEKTCYNDRELISNSVEARWATEKNKDTNELKGGYKQLEKAQTVRDMY